MTEKTITKNKTVYNHRIKIRNVREEGLVGNIVNTLGLMDRIVHR
jgi:hypothetical protein